MRIAGFCQTPIYWNVRHHNTIRLKGQTTIYTMFNTEVDVQT